MASNSKRIHVPTDVSRLPADYPFGDRLSESLSDYALREKANINTIRRRADRGQLPILQSGKRGHRRVNLYALYLQARYQAERYVTMTVAY